MLHRARTKYATANALWIEGDAMHLPTPTTASDLITAAFGFRNLSNYAGGLAEIHRVLRPGGQFGILECNHSDGLRGTLYNIHLHHILPSSEASSPASAKPTATYPPPSPVSRPPQMLALLTDAGFTSPTWQGYFLHAALAPLKPQTLTRTIPLRNFASLASPRLPFLRTATTLYPRTYAQHEH